ncbi:MAG: hypothetical protein ABSA76_11380 [Bacteroidales bacterium]
MEKLYYNLAEAEFTKGRKILIWVFFAAFFLGGVYVALIGPLFGVYSIKPALSLAPFGISLIVGLVATYATIKRKDLYFLIDDDKVEFRYGVFRPKKYTFQWSDMREIVMPHKERKIKVIFKDGTSYIIDLMWIQRKKSILIIKHFFHMARGKGLNVLKVVQLPPRRKK